MTLLRTFMLALMALAMVLTSGTMALARTAPDGQSIVICTGMGLSTVTVDADGNEVDPSPICPDCVMHSLALLNGDVQVRGTAKMVSFLQPTRYTPETVSFEVVQAASRGPPLAV